jgi:tRNA dimethylallyltransferase
MTQISDSNTLRTLPPDLPYPLVVVVGPTAVGKTEITLSLAKRLGGEIVSADSRLFYRGMDIGTAKPTPVEISRVPHHLIDVSDPDESWSLSRFQQAAAQAIRDIHSRGRLPFLVGGTGQYVHAVIQAWEIPPQEPDHSLRNVLEGWVDQIGKAGLHERLAILDPEAANAIDPRNMRRTIRALEVVLRTGIRFSAQRQHAVSPYSLLLIGLWRPREDLYRRIDERIEAMFAAGLVDEVRLLLEKGYSPELPTLSAIGYRETVAYLRGELTLDEVKIQMKRQTRRYVRHQGSWFSKNDSSIHWFESGPGTVGQVESLIRSGKEWIAPGTLLIGSGLESPSSLQKDTFTWD